MMDGLRSKFGAYLGFFLVIHFVGQAISDDGVPNHATAQESLKWDDGRRVVIPSVPGLRMFWWNIHEGSPNIGGPREDFQYNLSVLMHSSASPDVMAFAEYEPVALGDANIADMSVLYPYYQYFPYPSAGGSVGTEGVGVYSKYPFGVSSVDNYGARSLIILKLNANGKEVVFSPTHIEDQWRNFKSQRGTLKTIEQVFIGKHNPIYDQIVQFRNGLETHLGQRLYEKNFVIMGDFNSTKPSRNYFYMLKRLQDPIRGTEPTFPASGSDYRNSFSVPMQIDHIFVSPETDVESAQILPLLGSDHYALYMTIDLDN